MKAYTENELQEIVRRAYMVGFGDGRNRRDTKPEPPRVSDIHTHPRYSGVTVPLGRA